jgi:hypothetical protein
MHFLVMYQPRQCKFQAIYGHPVIERLLIIRDTQASASPHLITFFACFSYYVIHANWFDFFIAVHERRVLPFLLLVVVSMTVASEVEKHERWRMSSRGRWPDGGVGAEYGPDTNQ